MVEGRKIKVNPATPKVQTVVSTSKTLQQQPGNQEHHKLLQAQNRLAETQLAVLGTSSDTYF